MNPRQSLYRPTSLTRSWCLPICLVCITGLGSLGLSAAPFTAEQLRGLNRALEPLHAQYDPAEKMLRTPFSSPGYHTTLTGSTVHPTRTSLSYAAALLDTGDEEFRQRACAILRRVVALQDQNPESKTYGIWSWFLEEPLDKMSPPDWNWADFCGVALLQVALDHRDRLPSELRAQVDAAIRHAARSIQRRNVGPGYTNIAIMGSYVTLVAAEMFGLADLREYALARWRRFHKYTMEQGAFAEYNSPTYTVVALEELGRMRRDVKDTEARRLLEDVYRVAWQEIAQHFHPPTRQWAGPHSRCYRTLASEGLLALIQRGTDGRVNFGVDKPGLLDHRLPLPCPRDLEPLFTELSAPREVVKTFVKGQPPVVGTTYLHPAFTLGSINRGDLWNQRRPLIAYGGASNAPSCFRVRLLHDGYDFAAGQFFSVQQGGTVLAGINFATDGGDTHVSLDRLKNGVVRAKDLRVRFEFGGAAAKAGLPKPGAITETVTVRWAGVDLQLAVLEAQFGAEQPRWEITQAKDAAALDLVLYHGEEKVIRLAELQRAVVGFAVSLGANDRPVGRRQAVIVQDRLELELGGLGLSLPVQPAPVQQLQKSFLSRPIAPTHR